MEDVGEQLDAIRSMTAPLIFPVIPGGHAEHIHYSFEMARRTGAASHG
jgi:hypothetical protein